MKNLVKKSNLLYVAALITIGVLVFVAMNYSYFWEQAKYRTVGVGEVTQKQEDGSSKPVYEPNTVVIKSLGISAPIKFVTEANEAVFQEALQSGVVQFPNTAPVGTVGNTYIFGHSSDFAFAKGEYKTVFALLPSIKKDAEILVTNAEGKQFSYVVTDTFVANNTDLHLLDQNTGGKAVLTLQTSYPIGTALKRYIVKAELKP